MEVIVFKRVVKMCLISTTIYGSNCC